MEISFETRKLSKIFNSEKEMVKQYGPKLGKCIMRRLSVLEAAESLADIPVSPPFRRHELGINRQGQIAIDLFHPFRLIVKPSQNPPPLKKDGGLDLANIKEITILGVEDYH